MTVLNFPASPSLNDTYTENGVTYTWNGSYWDANNATSLDNVFVEVAGDSMTGNLLLPGGGGDTAALQKQEIEDFPVSTFDNDAGYITSADIPPGTVSYWKKEGSNVKPVDDTDNVNIGDGNILLSASGRIYSQRYYSGNSSNSETGTYIDEVGHTVSKNLIGSGTSRSLTVADSSGENLLITHNGDVKIGGIVASAPNITLSATDGRIIAKEQIKVGTTGSAAGTQGGYLWAGNDGANKYSALALYGNVDNEQGAISLSSSPDESTEKTVRFTVRNNGRVEVGSNVANGPTTTIHLDPADGIKVGGVMPNVPNIALNAATGDINTTGQLYSGLYDGLGLVRSNRTGDPNNLAFVVDGASTVDSRTFGIFGNGTVYVGGDFSSAAPNIQLNPDGKSLFKSNMTVVLGRVGDPSDAAVALQGSGGDFYATRYTNTNMCVVSSSSSGNNISWRASNSAVLMRLDDSGNLYTLGGVNTTRLLLNLEADDDTKYTTTTGDGGIEHRVYNGATLDVKESIETATAARTAMRETFQELRTAVQSATDFSQLKAAMLVALEDYAA